MKFKSYFLIVLMTLLWTSCNSEPQYSCDRNLDEWVKEHLTEIHTMSRANLLNCAPEISIACYRAFTPQQKFEVWKEKISEASALQWTENELKHINKITNFIETHFDFFYQNELSDDQLNELDLFTYEWIQYSQEVLSWDKTVCWSLVACINRVVDTNGNIEEFRSGTQGEILSLNYEATCNCSKSSDWCRKEPSGPHETCSDDKCEVKSGCGTLLMYSCDGACKPDGIIM